MDQALRPTADPAWLLSKVGYDPLRESSFETRFAISNGFLGLRGALATDLGACRTLPPRTYVAGLFDTALVGAPIPERLPAPDWLQLRIGLPDGPYLACPDPSSRDVTLDMRRGVLLTQVRQPPGATLDIRLSTLRLASLDMRGIVLQLVEFAVEQGMGEITVDVTCGEASPLLTPVTAEPDLGVWRTRQSGKALAIAMDAAVVIDGRTHPPTVRSAGKWSWSLRVQAGQTVVLRRILAVARGDEPVDDPGGRACSDLAIATGLGWRGLLERHETAWRERWDRSDVVVKGDREAQRALRFAVFHLNGAVLVEPRGPRSRWPPPHQRRHRTGRVPRDRRRQRLHQRHGAVEPPSRPGRGGADGRALAGPVGDALDTPRPGRRRTGRLAHDRDGDGDRA